MADFDVVLRGGTVIDGTGAPRFDADVAMDGKRIAAIGDLSGAHGRCELDVRGRIVAPGFIDAHTHDDRYLMQDPLMPAKLSQGVTTVVTGNCGISLAPWCAAPGQAVPPPLDLLGDDPSAFRYAVFGEYLDALERAGPAVNAACLVGHTTLRVAVMDRLDRAATDTEVAAMQALLRDAMVSGACGMSTGAAYPAAMSAPTDEMTQIATALHGFGGVHASHIRDEGDRVCEAIDEAVAIGAAGQAGTVVSHHKLIGPKNHGRSVETLGHLAQAMRHQCVGLDCYPYQAGSTILRKDRLAVSSRVIVTRSQPHPEFAGQDLDAIAATLGLTAEETVDVLQPAGAIYFLMDEADVRRILAFPQTMIGSDGLPHDPVPHPRLWGTFPRVLGHYSRDVGLFPLETAVHKMSGLTARHFGLTGRGVLAAGNCADVTVFDPARVTDTATFEQPVAQATGIALVFVNGAMAWRDGAATGTRAGTVIRHGHRA
ncbi:N-acyl-D-amino-acid deacylase family protein [Cupriavidus pauculus]|uniref:D-aminoacylase n=1 Tax=Cupriavidus pauculus TaxID=82633 RepID=A0A2N5C766_9BURK|nr:D-aminoacylase [Cupriavidus pauculus]PLP98030.1 D-aminoacylase [Cupriavidus pauculus]